MDTLSPLHSPVNKLNQNNFSVLKLFARAVPLPLVNLALNRVITRIAQEKPSIFVRLHGHHHKTFLIGITNLPLQLVLQPNPTTPRLYAYRNSVSVPCDARIAGSLLTLLGMVDGRYDGDALFFTRDLQVSGDTEAIVCLRNALDDMDGSIADDAAACFGPLGLGLLDAARRIGKIHDQDKAA